MSASCPEVLVLDSDSDNDAQLPLTSVRPTQSNSQEPTGQRCTQVTSQKSKPDSGKVSRKEKALAKAKAKEALNRNRVASAFAAHARSGRDHRNEIELMVSPRVLENTSKSDLLRLVRPLYPDGIVRHNVPMAELLFWRRKVVDGVPLDSSDIVDAGFSVLVLAAENFLSLFHQLDRYMSHVISTRPDTQVILATYGVERECQKRYRAQAELSEPGEIITLKQVQEMYTHLYLQHGVLVHDCSSNEDCAKYLQHLTDAVAAAPYYRQNDLLRATAKYRNPRKALRNRTAVMAFGEAPESQRSDDEEEVNNLENQSSWDRLSQDPHPSDENTVPIARMEGSGDLGYMYMAMLTQIPGVSAPRAQAIREMYPTLFKLLDAFSKCQSDQERERLLADIRCPNGMRLGPKLSKLVATVFTSLDPNVVLT